MSYARINEWFYRFIWSSLNLANVISGECVAGGVRSYNKFKKSDPEGPLLLAIELLLEAIST